MDLVMHAIHNASRRSSLLIAAQSVLLQLRHHRRHRASDVLHPTQVSRRSLLHRKR